MRLRITNPEVLALYAEFKQTWLPENATADDVLTLLLVRSSALESIIDAKRSAELPEVVDMRLTVDFGDVPPTMPCSDTQFYGTGTVDRLEFSNDFVRPMGCHVLGGEKRRG